MAHLFIWVWFDVATQTLGAVIDSSTHDVLIFNNSRAKESLSFINNIEIKTEEKGN